ncbi:MAG: protein YgfX [Methylococcales bacterium]
MSESSGLWLRISADPSRRVLGFLIAAHLLGLIGSLAAGLPTPVRAALALAVVCSGFFHFRKYRLNRSEARPLIVYGEQDGWSFQIGAGPRVHAELLASSVATRWITILHFRTMEKGFQTFLIVPDSLDSEDYRRLRMILKISEKGN